MNNEEYEKAYKDALEALHIGKLFIDAAGESAGRRVVPVASDTAR
jgi:hypothetical protein